MAAIQRQGKEVLSRTLERLRILYKNRHTRPGQLVQVGIKPHWTMITGSENECGIASNVTGNIPAVNTPSGSVEIDRVRNMIDRPLFEIAATGIKSDNLLVRSLGIAALSALSQQFLSCSTIRKRGFFSECWKATDPFIQQYPVQSRLINEDDIVIIIGHGLEIRNLLGRCRELHVMDSHSPAAFSTLLIDSSVSYGPDNLFIHRGKRDTEILQTADVILINASALIDGTFESLVEHSVHARLLGLCGLSGSLIPDAFFDQGVDFISSFRITDPSMFKDMMKNEHDVDYSFITGQKQFLMMNRSMVGRPGTLDDFASTRKGCPIIPQGPDKKI